MDGEDHDGLTAQSGQLLECVIHNPSAEIHSDFNHTGQVDFSADERALRTQFPGSILLPSLDGGNILNEYTTPVHIRPSEPQSPQSGSVFTFKFEHSADQERVIGYKQGPKNWQHVLGGRPRDDPNSYRTTISVPDNWTGDHVRLRATTLVGDPRRPGSADQPPPQEVQSNTGNNTHPGEVWGRLHPEQGSTSQSDDDLALFQIAPFLLQSDLAVANRLYVVAHPSTHNFVYDAMEAYWQAQEIGPPFERAYGLPFSPSDTNMLNEAHTTDAGACKLSSDTMYLIAGEDYREGGYAADVWVQDQMAIGYCSAPGGRAFNVGLHCKRPFALSEFIEDEMDDHMPIFNGLYNAGPALDGTEFGGNITVSPPVDQQTERHDGRQAGPPVQAHPRAPHGKIVLGDCYNSNRQRALLEESRRQGDPNSRKGCGVVHDETRHFLQSQEVQPIIPIDTSWLAVGHVDEILSFVPSPSPRVSGPAKLAMASPTVMDDLLRRTKRVPVAKGRTHFHRGRHQMHSPLIRKIIDGKATARDQDRFARSYDEEHVETFVDGEVAATSRQIHNRFLGPIEDRICRCTGLNRREDVLPLPVYFDHANPTRRTHPWGNARVDARTPNLVNMQVLKTGPENTHLLVPRPCGPRLPREEAETVVRSVLNAHGQPSPDVRIPKQKQDGKRGFPFWAWPSLRLDTLALFFTRKKRGSLSIQSFLTRDERDRLIQAVRNRESLDALPAPLRTAVQNTQEKIRSYNPTVELDPADRFTDWHRLFIPENTVDVLEAYTKSVLEGIGCQVHFVDAWYYHSENGGVHCATNVVRNPPSTDGDEPWWEHYDELARAPTQYNPDDTIHPPTNTTD